MNNVYVPTCILIFISRLFNTHTYICIHTQYDIMYVYLPYIYCITGILYIQYVIASYIYILWRARKLGIRIYVQLYLRIATSPICDIVHIYVCTYIYHTYVYLRRYMHMHVHIHIYIYIYRVQCRLLWQSRRCCTYSKDVYYVY